MAQTINTNVASLNAQRNLNSSQGSLATSLQRLSSGLRINSAKDDAAGLAISQRMSAQVRGLNQAARNANDGISMIQTAEGGMQQIQDMLIRMKELAVQGANSTLADTERGYLADEMAQLKNEINNISTRTKFNGQSLLDGQFGKSLDVASTAKAGLAVGTTGAVSAVDISGAAADTTFAITATATEITIDDGAGNAQTLSQSAIAAGTAKTLDFNNLGIKISISANTATSAADIGTALNGKNIVTTVGTDATIQAGADNSSDNRLEVTFADTRMSGAGASGVMVTLGTAIDAFDSTSSIGNAQSLITSVESAISFISEKRAALGAQQNRLEYTISNINTQSENIASSRGRIVDADFASETANLTRVQILQQAGTAMLAQANSLPQNVLSLLRG